MTVASDTYLDCLNDSYKFEGDGNVVSVTTLEDGRTAVILDKTIFYPQGGGQPADQGFIQSDSGKFEVTDVRLTNGLVHHYGQFVHGTFTASHLVNLSINRDRRILNARLHSAGHLIDIVMQELGLPLEPAKAYHFPDGPYVEYVGNFAPADKDDLAKQIQAKAEQLIQQNIPVNVTVADSAGASELCGELPDYIDKSKPIRVVSIGDNRGCPCAGTHIKELGEIGALTISKIRSKGDRTRISYSL